MNKSLKIGLGIFIIGLYLSLSTQYAHAFEFSDEWNCTDCSSCPTCNKWFRHVGIDMTASKGENVNFQKDGTVKQILLDPPWKYGVVIESGSNTYVIWHVDSVEVTVGKTYTAPFKIGVVANLGRNTHIHVGQRTGKYDSTYSSKGALPNCNHLPKGLVQYPENFVPPDTSVIKIN